MVLGNGPFDKILETLKISKEHAPHIGSNILKMYLFYILLEKKW